MEGTRTALAEKLGLLEEKVEQVTSTVSDTVEAVSETVEETWDAVEHVFDLKWHAAHHPWALVGGAVVVGFVGGRLLSGPRRPREWERRKEPPPPPPAPPAAAREKHEEPSSGWLGFLGREIGGLKKLGIGMAMSVLREVAVRALPQVSAPLSEAVNSLTEKLGGQPLGVSQPGHEPTHESPAPREEHVCEMTP